MLFSLIYISKAVQQMTSEQLLDLLEKSRQNNSDDEITGMLIYINDHKAGVDGRFMQVLEGEEQSVKLLYNKISHDSLHYQLTIVHQADIERRTFEQWQMGFKSINYEDYLDVAGVINLEAFFEETNSFSKFNIASNFLRSFYQIV